MGEEFGRGGGLLLQCYYNRWMCMDDECTEYSAIDVCCLDLPHNWKPGAALTTQVRSKALLYHTRQYMTNAMRLCTA